MRREIRELDLFDLSRPSAGAVVPWVRVAVGVAALAIVTVAAVAARALWLDEGLGTGLDRFWFKNSLAIAIGLSVAAAALPHRRISPFVRLATLLPIILLAGMIAAWVLWELIAPRMPYVRNHAPLVFDVPIAAALAAMLGATCLAALVVQRRRLDAWIRTLVVIALVELLLLGLWLPVVSWWWQSHEGVGWIWDIDRRRFLLGSTPGLLALVLVPPLVIATVFAAFASRRPELLRRTRLEWMALIALLFGSAVIARFVASPSGYFVYINLVHFLAASVFVATVALGTLVASLWWRGWRARRRLARDPAPVIGVIPGEPHGPDSVVACLELEGWLSGPRALVDSFEVTTAAGPIPIPIGAELAASVPTVSSVLLIGESVAVLRRGDRVVVGGLIEPAPDHPFRSSSALIPGPAGVVVRRHDDHGDGFTTAALIAWRPCVAFLAILVAVAIPALVGALALS